MAFRFLTRWYRSRCIKRRLDAGGFTYLLSETELSELLLAHSQTNLIYPIQKPEIQALLVDLTVEEQKAICQNALKHVRKKQKKQNKSKKVSSKCMAKYVECVVNDQQLFNALNSESLTELLQLIREENRLARTLAAQPEFMRKMIVGIATSIREGEKLLSSDEQKIVASFIKAFREKCQKAMRKRKKCEKLIGEIVDEAVAADPETTSSVKAILEKLSLPMQEHVLSNMVPISRRMTRKKRNRVMIFFTEITKRFTSAPAAPSQQKSAKPAG